ncbi:MAG: hypothetical protein NC915_02070 [Candidatus Omnitrophica bacterium]|nr:hypothetical protein [Candidatus Omnitrophota bacterium]
MDKRIVVLLILFVIIFEFQYIYMPNRKKLENLNALILKKEKEYTEFLNLCEKYKKSENEHSKGLKVVPGDFSFFSYLNDLIDNFNIRANVGDLKILPSEDISQYLLEKIQIDLNLMSLEQTLSLINKIEKTKGLYITRFEMKRDKDKPYLLNISTIISCLKQK